MKYYFLFIFLFVNAYMYAESISVESLRHHIIIAIDKAGCDEWIGNDEVGREVERLVLKQPFEGQTERKHLYQTGDYISFVGFGLTSYKKT